jgi:hypothetical protein
MTMTCAGWLRSSRWILAIAMWLILWCAGTASAQTAPQPWIMTAPANPDHNTIAQTVQVVASYELTVTPQGGTALAPLNLGKPPLMASCTIAGATVQNCISADVNTFVNGLPPGTYTAVLKALGPGGSAVSPAGNPFPLTVPAPGAQGAPGLSRSASASSRTIRK